ncbi:hypothetical protein AGMMS50293_20540 [Spirochaetia bacterium]|nr:hypothetical protein AGMMS50293_20540 [Spirochaetia bacterium]
MKIVSWNCHSTFGKGLHEDKATKFYELLEKGEFVPDILVLQEINEDEIQNLRGFSSSLWYGDHKNAEPGGIAIFWKDPYRIKRVPEFDSKFRYVVPYRVTGGREPFTLFAVWTKGEPLYYENNVIEAIKHYSIEKQSIVIGDYNTFAHNADTKYRHLVNCARNTEAGKNTFYSPRYKFGIDDFCFATPDIANKIDAKICQDSETEWEEQSKLWRGLSDHCPISVEFNL